MWPSSSSRREQRESGCTERACKSPGQYECPVYLFTAMLPAQTPLAKVLAVVAERVIGVLADPGPRSPNHFLAVEASGTWPNPKSMCIAKL